MNDFKRFIELKYVICVIINVIKFKKKRKPNQMSIDIFSIINSFQITNYKKVEK